MSDEHEIDWQAVGERLRAPFDPNDVDFRVQGRVNEQTGKGQVVAYIDARSVQDRLDEVAGPGNWAFEWEPIVVDKGEVQIAKGTLTIHGVSKSDAGTASNFEATLGAVSHCFKRAAVHWGIGRYLYGVSSAWVQIEKGGRISNEVLRELRAKLPRPDDTQPQPTLPAFTANPPVIHAPADEPVATPTPTAKPARQFATPQQWTAIHNLCEKTRAIPPEPGSITTEQAGALIAELSETYKHISAQRQREGVAR